MAYHTPEAKTERAIKSLFEVYKDTDLQGVQILQRFYPDAIATPMISIVVDECAPADNTEEIPVGNYDCSVTITLKVNCNDTTVIQHDAWLACVADILNSDNFVDSLNEVMVDEEFNAMQWTAGRRSHGPEGNLFVSKIAGTLYMMPSKA